MHTTIRAALKKDEFKGYICEAGFRIEAVSKKDRAEYFSSPQSSLTTPRHKKIIDGVEHVCIFSFGPDDEKHPGLPEIQEKKFLAALSHGILLLRGMAWMGLPSLANILSPELFEIETKSVEQRRIQLQHDVYAALNERSVGKAAFDEAGGWTSMAKVQKSPKRFQKACAEWADGEIVAAHIAYKNDILCTADYGNSAGASVFDVENRKWLSERYGVKFKRLDELLEVLKAND